MRPLFRALTHVRLLPIVIASLAVLAGFKVAVLVFGLGGTSPLTSASRVMFPPAQASSAPAPARPASPVPASPPPVAPTPVEAPPAEPPVSDSERALLQDLRARRVELETRDKAVGAREALLAAAERRLSERVEQLGQLQAKLEALEETRRERDEANWRGLVKTYETMRPRDAAAILNDLDQTILMQVLDRMKEAKAAPILAAMPPDRARAATTELAKWRSRTPEQKL